MSDPFSVLREVPPTALAATRLQLHHALQVPASFGPSLLAPRPDWSHLAFTVDVERGVLWSEPDDRGQRAGLGFEPFAWVVQSATDEASLEVAGHSPEEGRAWMARTLSLPPNVAALSAPPEGPPAREEGEGPFGVPDAREVRALAAWYVLAQRLLDGRRGAQGAPALRLWPHHFDLALAFVLDPERDPEHARTVSLGFSPGDGSYAEPYVYATPWPIPGPEVALAALPAGHWHREGWTGAVLRATELVAAADPFALGDSFLAAAEAGCRAVV